MDTEARLRLEQLAETTPEKTGEDTGSFLENIKSEWKLFWMALSGDDQAEVHHPTLAASSIQALNIDQIKQITRSLSQDRKRLNQCIEELHKELEQRQERIGTIELVGGDIDETLEEINQLNEVGQKISMQLQKIDHQLGHLRVREDEIRGLK